MSGTNQFGWRPDPAGVEDVLMTEPNSVFCLAARNVLNSYEETDTHLWVPLVWASPEYRRGAQAIGSCVGWGAELACTILTAKIAYKRRSKKVFREASTEACYGGSRVEGRGKDGSGSRPVGGWSDGSYGAAAAKFVRQFGVAYRDDYSTRTKKPEHDLRRYDGRKEKNWGAYGCGGQGDNGLLDAIAKEKPVKTISQCNSFDDVAAAIAGSKCPVTNASMYGCSMKRDRYGECRWDRQWPHQMCWIAVRFGKRPAALCAQSWGPRTCSGPSGDDHTENLPPRGTPANILGFTWWMPSRDVDRVCRSGDCWAYGDIDGWKLDKTDWSKLWGG